MCDIVLYVHKIKRLSLNDFKYFIAQLVSRTRTQIYLSKEDQTRYSELHDSKLGTRVNEPFMCCEHNITGN